MESPRVSGRLRRASDHSNGPEDARARTRATDRWQPAPRAARISQGQRSCNKGRAMFASAC